MTEKTCKMGERNPGKSIEKTNLVVGKSDLPVRDILALQRTKLANERTFLAYFRTAVVFLSSGFAIFQIESLNQIKDLGFILMIIGPLVLILGFIRFFITRKTILKHYKKIE